MIFQIEVKFAKVAESALTGQDKIFNIVNRMYQLINT